MLDLSGRKQDFHDQRLRILLDPGNHDGSEIVQLKKLGRPDLEHLPDILGRPEWADFQSGADMMFHVKPDLRYSAGGDAPNQQGRIQTSGLLWLS